MNRVLSIIVALLLLTRLVVGQPASTELLPNGSLETLSADGQAVGWGLKSSVTLEKDGDNHFLRLKSPKPGEMVMVYRKVDLKPDVKALELKFRVRYEGIEKGKQSWFDGRIILNFKDAGGDEVKPGPKPPAFVGTSKGWVEKSQRFQVPAGATTLEMLFSLFNVKAGQIDFDDVSLKSIPVEPLIRAEEEARAKEAARIAALPKPKPKVGVPPAEKLPKPLHVEGNQIKDSGGNAVWLQGVAIPSLEFSGAGEHILESVETAIIGWKANCIRLPVSSKFWFGVGPYQRDGGMGYRQTVDDAINLCGGHGVYLVLDLHEYRAPTEQHAKFWAEAAAKYKDHPAVLFELLNEPHDISWDVWRNGGRVTDKPKAGNDVAAENKEKLKGFDSIGMQKLLETIRETGAKNIVIAGGLDWGYDLSGILDGHALKDPGGNGIVYSSHVYPWKSDWKHKFIDASAKVPLFLGEVGADEQKMAFLPPERQEDPYTWVPDMLGVIQKYKLNWTAWSFHPKASPRVLKDWTYEPTPFWGAFVKKALAGEKFEMKKER